MDWDVWNLGLQAGTLLVGAYVTIFPPQRSVIKIALLSVIVACGSGGIFAAHRASVEAEAKTLAAQAEVIRLSHDGDKRVAEVQERLEDVSERLAANGIAADPENGGSASTALETKPQRRSGDSN